MTPFIIRPILQCTALVAGTDLLLQEFDHATIGGELKNRYTKRVMLAVYQVGLAALTMFELVQAHAPVGPLTTVAIALTGLGCLLVGSRWQGAPFSKYYGPGEILQHCGRAALKCCVLSLACRVIIWRL